MTPTGLVSYANPSREVARVSRHHFFLSYASADRRRASVIADALSTAGFRVWFDRSKLVSGDSASLEIERAIRDARSVVVLWSSSSVESRWVTSEAHKGFERNVLLPVLLDPASPPVPFNAQTYFDLTMWRGAAEDPVLRELVEHLAQRVGEDGSTGEAASSDVRPTFLIRAEIGGEFEPHPEMIPGRDIRSGTKLGTFSAFGERFPAYSMWPGEFIGFLVAPGESVDTSAPFAEVQGHHPVVFESPIYGEFLRSLDHRAYEGEYSGGIPDELEYNAAATPLVEVGTSISIGEPLCGVYTMGLICPIESTVEGVVHEILAADRQRVGIRDALFSILPESPHVSVTSPNA